MRQTTNLGLYGAAHGIRRNLELYRLNESARDLPAAEPRVRKNRPRPAPARHAPVADEVFESLLVAREAREAPREVDKFVECTTRFGSQGR